MLNYVKYINAHDEYLCEISIILLHREIVNKTSIFRVKKKEEKGRKEIKNENMKNHAQKNKGKHAIEISFCLILTS